MAEYSQAGQDEVTAARQTQSGSYAAAIPAMRAATIAVNMGNRDMKRATTALPTG